MKSIKKVAIAILTIMLACLTVTFQSTKVEAAVIPVVYYHANVQKIGWQSYVKDGATAGTVGKGLRMETFSATVSILPVPGDISYSVYVENHGWQNRKAANQIAGTVGQNLRIEAIRINLIGDFKNYYNVYYRTYIENHGWLGWTKNGDSSGSVGQALRMEGIQIKLVKKGGTAPGSEENPFIN